MLDLDWDFVLRRIWSLFIVPLVPTFWTFSVAVSAGLKRVIYCPNVQHCEKQHFIHPDQWLVGKVEQFAELVLYSTASHCIALHYIALYCIKW